MSLKKTHLRLILIFCSTLLGVSLWSVHTEYDRPWKKYQKQFRELIDNSITEPELIDRTEKIRQIWLPDIHITDRCTTCHMGTDEPNLHAALQPFLAHSGDYLSQHPVEKFGCVVCHEGQGEALTVNAAHGDEDNWPRKLLRGRFAQASCRKCHPMSQGLPYNMEMPGGAILVEGWRLFRQYNCLGCHKLPGYKRPERIAPSLSFTGRKVQQKWLFNWLKDPKAYLPKTKMPRYRLSDEDISYIAAYLMNLTSPPFIPPINKEEHLGENAVDDGQQLVLNLGCPGCHKIDEKGVAFGPDFSNIGNKVKPEWLYHFLRDPKGYDPKTIIPDFNLHEKDIPAIAAYLMSLKKDEISQTSQNENNTLPEYVEKGQQLVKDLGCRGCHEIEEISFRYVAPELDGVGRKRMKELYWGNITDADKTLINWLMIKVSDPGRFDTGTIINRMPNHNFTKYEAEAIVTFLLSFTKEALPSDYVKVLNDESTAESRGRVIIERYNCRGCHIVNKLGGTIGPELTHEGKKSRPEWLYNFLKQPHKIRPSFIVKATMPNFLMTDREVSDVIEYFAFLVKESYPYNLVRKKAIHADDFRAGEKLYDEVFACIACHSIDGRGGKVGPEHTDLASRLKKEWIEKWLKNPQDLKPDVRMPRFKFKDWEFEALTDYLMTRGSYRFVQPIDD